MALVKQGNDYKKLEHELSDSKKMIHLKLWIWRHYLNNNSQQFFKFITLHTHNKILNTSQSYFQNFHEV
jgi:hypothetical protein